MRLFQWLSDLFGKPNIPRPPERFHEFKGGLLDYKPDLIQQLTHEHRLLESAYGELVHAHAIGDYDTCIAKLRRFTGILRAHLLKENTLLYVYLRKVLEHDAENSALVNYMRMEMQGIGKVLNQFVHEYTTSPWDSEKRKQLGVDLERIKDALLHRIETEESALYPLYLPESEFEPSRFPSPQPLLD